MVPVELRAVDAMVFGAFFLAKWHLGTHEQESGNNPLTLPYRAHLTKRLAFNATWIEARNGEGLLFDLQVEVMPPPEGQGVSPR